jgi:excisionase family DNA binding protein
VTASRKRGDKDMTQTETITVQEAGRRLGISRNTAYECAARGEIPTLRLGKRLVVPIKAFNRILEQGAGAAPSSVPRSKAP